MTATRFHSADRHVLNGISVLDHLARDLSRPPFTATVTELAALWQVEILTVLCDLPPGLEDHPELSVRVRGAFGRQLHGLPPRRTATGGERPAAWDVLAAPLGQVSAGVEVPKPVVIRASARGDTLVIEMRILGAAAAWFDEAASALIAALEGGIALRSGGRLRAPLLIRDMTETRMTGVPFAPAATTATLHFRSPVLARQKNRVVDDPRAILRGVVRRVDSLARWHATAITVDRPALSRSLESLRLDDKELRAFRWERFSIRQGDTPIPAAGWLGVLGISGQLEPIGPFLALAETMNTGAQASLGLGWFELAMA